MAEKTDDAEAWEERYAKPGFYAGTEPVAFLSEVVALLPQGDVLDLAMGEGRNALFLAERGFRVFGLDRSPTAVMKAHHSGQERGLKLFCWIADLEQFPLPVHRFDIALCFYFLERRLWRAMQQTVKPGGYFVAETYTVGRLGGRLASGPRRPDHLLRPGELRTAFEGWSILLYREMAGKKAVTSLLARKPAGDLCTNSSSPEAGAGPERRGCTGD